MPLVRYRFVLGQNAFEGTANAFRKQIQLAKKHKLPIVIHCREAFDEIFEILEEENRLICSGYFIVFRNL
jgi:Tat protein secretion system quality control protein TatD with DNase activity